MSYRGSRDDNVEEARVEADDGISLPSSDDEDNDSLSNSFAEQPQLYTTSRAIENDRFNRVRTREEEVLSDEEYLDPRFNDEDIDDELSMDQNINLYLLNSSQDMAGGRHLSVGMDQRPNLSGDVESTLSRPPTNLQRRRSSVMQGIKRTSTFQSIQKMHLWDDEFKRDRIKVYSGFLLNYLALGIGFVVVLSIYWGSLYHRNYRYKNMKMLVVIEDQTVGSLPPVIGEAIEYTAGLSAVKTYGDWRVYNHTEFSEIAAKHNNTIAEEVRRQVHHRLYWSAIYVKENATLNLFEKMVGLNDNVVVSELIDAVYESGRDPILMTSYVTNFIFVFETLFLKVAASAIYPNLLSAMSSEQISNISVSSLSDPLLLNRVDNLPLKNPVIFAPLQLGLVYIIIFAFFQFLLSLKIQIYVAARVKGAKYILFRIITSHVAYIVLSLAYSSLNAAYGLEYNASFGNSGFLVMWAVAYLTIASLGGLNENMALLCFAYFPPLIGLWLIFLMVSNIAPTFSPLALCPIFYRYGYAMPIHNSYELLKIIFFDGYKGQAGRNFGILVAWIIVTNLFLPVTMKHVVKVNKRNQEKAAEKEAREKR